MLLRPVPLVLLALGALAALPARAQAQGGRHVSLVAPDVQACKRGRPARARAQEAICVMGVASDPAGVERVLVNGVPATLTAVDSASGQVQFMGFVPPTAGTTEIQLAVEPKGGGAPQQQKYGIIRAEGEGDGATYTIVNLSARVLGGTTAADAAATPIQRVAIDAPSQAASPPATIADPTPPADPAPPVSAPAASDPAPAASASDPTSAAALPTAVQAVAAANPAPADPSAAAPADPSGTVEAAVVDAPVSTDAAAPPAQATMAESTRDFISISEPREWAGVTSRGITVQPRQSLRVVGLAQHSLGIARVEVNGVRASFSPDPNGGGMRFTAYVAPDPSMREVEVVVRPAAGPPLVKLFPVQLGARTVAAEGETPAPAASPALGGFKGRRFAVVVGISQYSDAGINGLQFADDDARAFYDFLRSPMAGAGGFAEENVRLLLNEQATYRNIRSALFTFLKAATADDQVVIYFAGHGAPDPQRLQNLYLLTHDTELADISSTGLPMDDVTKAVNALYARDILVITDACHSAGVGGQLATRDLGLNQINESFLQALNASQGGLAIFTASGANQLSQEDARWGGGHGVFTHYLLEGLRGAADEDGDRIVTLVEMMEYTRAKVRAETRNAQIPTISQTTYDLYWPVAIVSEGGAAAAPGSYAAAPSAPVSAAAAPVEGARQATATGPARPAATPAQLQAIARFQEAVRLYPRSAVYRKNLGVALRDAGKVTEAIPEFQEAAKLEPQNAELVYELGMTFQAAGMAKEALAEFENAVRLDNRSALYANALGNALLADGQTSPAVDRLRRAVSVERTNARYHRDLGAALAKAGKPGDAAEALQQATALEERNAGYRFELATVLQGLGRSTESLPAFREAARLEPGNASYRAALARALRAEGMNGEALQEMQQAVRLEPRNARYQYELGTVQRDMGNPYETLVAFREAAKLEPATALYRYEVGAALQASGQAAEALPDLQEAAKLEAGNAQYQNALGNALKDTGAPQDALAALREAARIGSETAKFHYDLGRLLKDLGMTAEARASFEAAVRLDGRNREYRDALNAARRQ